MLLRRLILALLSLGLLGFPLSRLYCANDDKAAMACCQNPQGCNRAGKSDDCCRTVPNDGNDSGTLVKSLDAAAPMHVAAVIATSAFIVRVGMASAGHHPVFTPDDVPLDLPPPLLSPLRI